jgi:hypothetical protein
MKKGFYSLLFFAIISAVSAQEKIKYFDLSYTDKKIENSLYSNIKFLDSREDTSGMGIVRVGFTSVKDRRIFEYGNDYERDK